MSETYARYAASWREGWRRANAWHQGLHPNDYAANPLRNVPPRVRSGAWHESGHACVGVLLGGHFDYVDLRRDGSGECAFADGLSRDEELMFVLAGEGITVLTEERGAISDSDMRRSIALAGFDAAGQERLAKACAAVRSLLNRERRAVFAVAVALVQRGRLDHRQVRAIMRAAGARV